MEYSDTEQSEAILNQIGEVKKNINVLKKERKQVSNQIDVLMNDIECARRAKELSDAAVLATLKKLREIFGKSLKSEEISDKVIELFERKEKAVNEVANLNEKIKQKQIEEREQKIRTKQESSYANKEIESIKEKEKQIESEISNINKKAQQQRLNTKEIEDKYKDIAALKDGCDILSKYRIEEIIKMIGENSDKSLAKKCRICGDNVGITFNGNIATFLQNFADLAKELKSASKERIPKRELAERVNKEIERLNNAKENKVNASMRVKNLTKELNSISKESKNERKDLVEKEKKKKAKRIAQLKESLTKASKIASLEVEIGDKLSDVCDSYISFSENLKYDIAKSKNNEELPIDLETIRRKVRNVKMQNGILCKRLKQIV